MTQTAGLDVLIAWAVFLALLGILAWFLMGPHPDPNEVARRSAAEEDGRASPPDATT